MSEDIDIKKHDLIEKPRVRNIFSDLTVLGRKIIVGADHGELQKESKSKTLNRQGKLCLKKQTIIDENVEELETEKNLILEPSNPDESKKIRKSLLHSNIIVFGNKYSKTCDNKLKYHAKINIKDISHYLKKSKSYCRICKKLFLKTSMFEEHKILSHKDMFNKNGEYKILNHEDIVVDSNRDSIGGQENNTRDGEINISEENETNKCYHCKQIFSTRKLLIEHMYEVLDKNAKIKINNVDKHCKTKNNSNENAQQVVKKTVENSKDEGIQDTNSLPKTILVNESISENESYSGSQNQTEVVCVTNQNEILQCTVCFCYFQHLKFYLKHMERKHKTKVRQFKVVKFNPKCIFCPNSYPTFTQYNLHLRRVHTKLISDTNCEKHNPNQNQENSTVNSNNSVALEQQNTTTLSLESSYDLINDRPLIFKSILFKCLKCEINFLSPKLATSHNVHSEILINWKCSLCEIYFKRSDEVLHLKQHKYTDSFNVVNVEDKDSSKIMIKCAKCPLHIPESDFRRHLNVCGEKINTWHCDVCNIDIYGNLKNKRAHNALHSDIDGKKSDFIIIDDSLLNPEIHIDYMNKSQQVKVTSITGQNIIKKRKRKVDETPNQSKKLLRKLKELSSSNDDHYSKFIFQRPDTPTFLLNLAYCKNCECFINFYYRLEVHVENRCRHLAKRVCNICGIVFTPKTILRHKLFHELNPHLKLQDFRFYDIHTCELILPPVPIYPKCDICEAHFVRKDEIRFHTCSETPNLYCDICELKFASEIALNLHIPFHGYYLPCKSPIERNNLYDVSPDVSKKNKRFKNSVLKKPAVKRHNKEDRNENKSDNVMDVDEPQQLIENDKILAVPEEEHNISFSQENDTNDKRESIEHVYYLYTCEICNVTVAHYDQLVEHCHSHYNNSYRKVATEKCTQCNLIFDHSCMFSHIKEMHESDISSESFVKFTCDLFYFGRSNVEWLNHVFKSVPESRRESILKYAIYKDEYRIKLDVSQQGDPEFTLYQCTKCSIFTEPSDMVDHRKKCKGSDKVYPCHHCGVPFLSAPLRARHLELHERHDLSAKSYRIVVFNRKKDNPLNDLLLKKTNQYVLYKCRNCHGVVDWSLVKSHHCNLYDLKKCTICGLLIYSTAYDKHNARHKTIDTFVASNMRVVMFGQVRGESKETDENYEPVCSFSGIVSDYIFYKCVKCNVCIENLRHSSKHFCLIAAAKFHCPKCNLYFDPGKKKDHYAMHYSEKEITSDSVCVIPFDPQETYSLSRKSLE
ncbi:zinc finger protein 91-like [Aricia agestis]|uniref:zinc finger protein 91-like n=1 Tax=Aricia agestis TaxID=91739 RepID=UPI001C209F36|nr:zinc finger protein 91-like [Aricia agestis]